METSFRPGHSTTSSSEPTVRFSTTTTSRSRNSSKSERVVKYRHSDGALLLLVLVPLCIVMSLWTTKMHYSLPKPLTSQFDAQTGLPQLSETAMLAHAKYLSETIGFRTVGTKEHALGDRYVLEQAELIQRQCETVIQRAKEKGRVRRLQCEVWRQEGSGTHRFDFMNKRVYKHYEKLSNIILRISDGTQAGKEHALLLNSHVDSMLPSPGAADDALSVGIMLEIARVLVHTPTWEPKHAVVFLFNNAEESLQDGSHLFATQSIVAPTIRAVVNLEAAGTTGPEILFQATSEEMIEAYSHVPHPYATVLANDVFQSGIILSDTDFRQFQEYGNLTGLDMAIVGDSYLYHTRKDLVQHIGVGVAQHFADNVHAIVHHLTTSPTSALPGLAKSATPVTTLYYSMLGRWFIKYDAEMAWKIFIAIIVTSLAILLGTTGPGFLVLVGKSIIGALLSIVAAVLSANVVAFLMKNVLNAGMSWYSKETSCLVLYGPPTLAGALLAQYFVGSSSSSSERRQLEYATLKAFHFLFVFLGMALQYLGLGSSTLMALFAVGSTAAIGLNAIANSLDGSHAVWTKVEPLTYVVALVLPVVTGTQLALGLLDIFVPLTGRMGEVAPVEHIIATIAAMVGILNYSYLLPVAHRVGRKFLMNVIIVLIGTTAFIMILFAFVRTPYDSMHQKRVYALHVENITTNEYHLHVASSDGGPNFEELVNDIAVRYGPPGRKALPEVMNDWNSDWDVLYPFSQFLTPYKIGLPRPPSYNSPWASQFVITTENDEVDLLTYTRKLTLVIDHPGVIWTVIAFDAHVLSWSLDKNPMPYRTRHHLKEASFYGVTTWKVDLLITVPRENPEEDLVVNYIGIVEKGSWPGKKHEKDVGPAMNLFADLDQYLYDKTDDSADVMLLSCVGGVAHV